MDIRELTLPGLTGSSWCVFACGADVKNRFSFYRDGRLHLSATRGDLSEPDTFTSYVNSIGDMQKALGATPDLIAHDLHPGYFSSRVEGIFPDARRVGVQHHYAHIAGALAASGARETVIGVAFDGTGYGTDGTIWGGEFIAVSPGGWRRCGHLAHMKMPGGEAAAREPWRMACAVLHDVYGDKIFESHAALLKHIPEQSRHLLRRMLNSTINTPLTSSCGRLFDAVSSLLGIAPRVQHEAEAAIMLEERASAVTDAAAYPFEIASRDGIYVAGYGPMIEGLLSDLRRGIPVERLARRFHNSLAALIVEMAVRLGADCGTNTVALSGGVFGNKLLYTVCADLLRDAGFTLLENIEVPTNDLGICVGQTYAALSRVMNTEYSLC